MKTKKPKVKLTGTNGNVFSLLGICKRALIKAGMEDKAKELNDAVLNCPSYQDAIAKMGEYVDVK